MKIAMRPLVIVGGGLCGLSLGLALRRRNVPVTVHEAGHYPRHRVCGEFISGVRREVFQTLGMEEVMEGARRQEGTVWYHGERQVLVARLPERAWGISRWVLDQALREKFQAAGGLLIEHSRRPADDRMGQVWSAGRVPARGPWIGLKYHVHGLELAEDLEVHLGRNGYVGLAQVEAGKVNVCGLFRQDRSLRGADLLGSYLEAGGLFSLSQRIREAEVDESSRAAVAGFRLGRQKVPSGRLALGDAWGMMPPFTGNGMSMAFESAELAVEPLCQYAAGARDWETTTRWVGQRMRRKFSLRLLRAGLLHPGLTWPSGQAFLSALTRSGGLPFSLCFRLMR